ncbi:MAG: hypothetical protein HGB26_03235 [Desulfobulbaceae bacterium]|nr:hypothetical protein [Desulfobulbaceae bacterium]
MTEWKERLVGQVKLLLVQKMTNQDMEGVMTISSELMVIFLMLPVFIQIIIPLLMLIGFGIIRAVWSVVDRQESDQVKHDNEKVAEDLQLDRA